jgi:transcription elongation factor Elf1
LGRRRRRVIRIVKKKLPTVFVCPRCGEEAVRVTIAKDTGHAVVLCALCNLKDEFPAHPAAQAIDVYSYFTDRFYGVKDPRPIIPHDREIQYTPAADEPEEQTAEKPTMELSPEPPRLEVEVEKPELESQPPLSAEVSPPESSEVDSEQTSIQQTQAAEQESSEDSQVESPAEPEKESQEEREPFADILVENKDKKRYSSTPLPQQTSEQTS